MRQCRQRESPAMWSRAWATGARAAVAAQESASAGFPALGGASGESGKDATSVSLHFAGGMHLVWVKGRKVSTGHGCQAQNDPRLVALCASSLGPVPPEVCLGSPSDSNRHLPGRAPKMAMSLSAASCCASSQMNSSGWEGFCPRHGHPGVRSQSCAPAAQTEGESQQATHLRVPAGEVGGQR